VTFGPQLCLFAPLLRTYSNLTQAYSVFTSTVSSSVITMAISFLFLLSIILYAAWQSLAHLVYVYFPPLRNKRIGIVIAHPDDEAMFFSPTVIALTEPRLKNHVRVLCLCSGRLRFLNSDQIVRLGVMICAYIYWF
jgi:GlcNAc-PI de-N-acetylase